MLPPGFMCSSSVAEHGQQKSSWLGVSHYLTTPTCLCYQHYSHNKSNTVLATMKKINAVLDRIRTAADCFLPHPASDNSGHMELDDITDLGMLVVPIVPRGKMQSYVVLLSLLNILVF